MWFVRCFDSEKFNANFLVHLKVGVDMMAVDGITILSYEWRVGAVLQVRTPFSGFIGQVETTAHM